MTSKKEVARKKCSYACISCRSRKVKCNVNEQFPCRSCVKMDLECVKSTSDKRKIRVEKKTYVQNLENKIQIYNEEAVRISKQLENISKSMKDLSSLTKVQNLENKQNEFVMDSRTASNTLLEEEPKKEVAKSQVDERHKLDLRQRYPTPESFQEFQNKFLSVYGPTSIFDDAQIPKYKDENEINGIEELSSDPLIVKCVKLFFVWQYPDMHIFLFREAFLLDFFHAKPNSSYCSKALVFAICAMGSLFSNNPKIKEMSPRFYENSRSLCFQQYNKPSIALLQSFLLLGLYDVYNGRNDSGWILSGIAMRLVYVMGLQLNPKQVNTDIEAKNELGTKIRSRIFWGAYLVDHFLGLLLGRPSSLKKNNSTIEQTIELPDIEWIHEYSFQEADKPTPKILILGNPLRALVELMSITERIINDIFSNKTMEDNSSDNFEKKLNLVTYYNLEIEQWRIDSSEQDLWTAKVLSSVSKDPTKLTFTLIYYVVILCLNRPFLKVQSLDAENNMKTNSLHVCMNAIDDLHIAIKGFVRVYGFGKCSILIIYCCVISTSVIIRSKEGNIEQLFKYKSEERSKILLFLLVLQKCSSLWGLSKKAYTLVETKLRDHYNIDINFYLTDFNMSASPQPAEPLVGMLEEMENDMTQNNSNGCGNQMFDYATCEDDAFGGPPIFMNSDVLSTFETLFEDYNLNSIE